LLSSIKRLLYVRFSKIHEAIKLLRKHAEVTTPLNPHQQRVVDRISKKDQPGLLVAHGLGSGKTLTSIAAQSALGVPSAVVVPASLVENYKKELHKHTKDGSLDPTIVSLQKVTVQGSVPEAGVLVVDEAHRARETSTKSYQVLKKNQADKRILLTASPFYNRPSDIAALVNIVAGGSVLPLDQKDFESKYIREKKIGPGFWGTLRGVKPGSVPVISEKKIPELKAIFDKWVDYHPSSDKDFPRVEREDVKVPMTSEQRKHYDVIMRKAPSWAQYKVRKGLPPSKQEAKDLNAFMTGLRQVSLSTAPYITKGQSSEAKVEAAFQNLKKEVSDNPNAKAVVYSNYLEAGLSPYKERLDQSNIPYGEFTGNMKKRERDQMVRDFNDGKIKALLLSSAGGEGLDLKGTSLIQILEPHWNQEKIRQVEGRGIRYKSHEHLPEEQRVVKVQRYIATLPNTKLLERVGLRKPGSGADEYLVNLSKQKDDLIDQFRKLLH
jgi:SNF2 family DNA or RNA helicase